MTTIRKAEARDAEPIARVHVATWRSTYPGQVPDSILVGMSEQRHAEMWRRSVAQPRGDMVFVADHPEDGVVGFASCGPLRGSNLPFAGEVYTLYIQQDHQGKGLGRRLLASSFKALLERGYPSVVVWVLASNPSRFFYRAMGGELVADRTEALWGVLMDETAYGWRDVRGALASPRLAAAPPEDRA
jgi:GNAT superfamily N-acetyltransferase